MSVRRRELYLQLRSEAPALTGLAVPIVIGYAASMMLGITDSLMLAPLGSVPLAAVGLATAISGILYSAVWGLLGVLGVQIGVAWGAGDELRIPELLRNGLMLGLLAGLSGAVLMGLAWFILPFLHQPQDVLTALPLYWLLMALMMIPFAVLTVFKSAFEAVDRPWLGAGFAFLAVGVNIPLNYWLIWGGFGLPPLGLVGAGLASVLAETLALAAAWVFWKRAWSMRRLRLRRPLDWAGIVASGREGASLGVLYTFESGAMAVGTLLIGTFGTVALAANQVVHAVSGMLYMVPLGIAGAVTVRIAQENGAGNRDALRPIALSALVLALGWLVIAALIFGFGGRAIAAFISNDAAVVAMAAQMFIVIGVLQVSDGVYSTMLGTLRGMSDTRWPAWMATFAYWGVSLPVGWVLAYPLGFGPVAIWVGLGFGVTVAALALALRFRFRTSGQQALPFG